MSSINKNRTLASSLPPSEWMEKIIRLSSVTERSNAEVIRFLLPLVEGAGLGVRIQEVRENGESFFNLVAHNGQLNHKRLVALHTHLDTVAPGPRALWTQCRSNPFTLTSKGPRRYGLGSADVKLDFLCKLWAVKQSAGNLPPLALVGTYGEERGLVGARRLLETKWYRPKFALVGEPSLLEIIFAHKGHLVVEVALPHSAARAQKKISVLGKAAHSSTPHLGKNAIELGLGQIFKKGLGIASVSGGVGPNTIPPTFEASVVEESNQTAKTLAQFFEGLNQIKIALAKKRDARFNPSSATLSVNQIFTEKKAIHLVFDVRLLPQSPADEIQKEISLLTKKLGLKLVKRELDPSLDGGKSDELIQTASRCLKSIGVKPQIKTKASCTEAALYFEKGAQAFVFGPGKSIGNVHRPNEYNEIPQLEKATRFYFEMLQTMARKA